jgi:hypothetical protein
VVVVVVVFALHARGLEEDLVSVQRHQKRQVATPARAVKQLSIVQPLSRLRFVEQVPAEHVSVLTGGPQLASVGAPVQAAKGLDVPG